MISNREIKEQIDGLTEQHLLLTQELQQIKDLIRNQSNNNQNASNQNNSQGNNNQNSDTRNNQSASSNNEKPLEDIANDFMKLKDLTSTLELKMQEYMASNQKSSTLSNEDVISLILNMMNGMIDWTKDLISQQNSKTPQLQ